MFELKQATKTRRKLRAAIYGPAGSGKTLSCLRIAAGLGGKIGVIDTEHGSASIYSDRHTFLAGELHGAERTIENYCRAMDACAAAGVEVLIIDSLTHAWQELLEEIDRIAKSSRFNGNKWSAWSEGTPKQKQLVEKILAYPGHVLVTMRSKTEWATEQDSKGKTKPVRIGLAPEQGKGIEYEFDLLFELSQDHVATVIKDRSGVFQDKAIEKPDEATGKALAEWLASAPEAPKAEPPVTVTEPPKPPPAPNGNGKTGWKAAIEYGVDRNIELYPLDPSEPRKARFDWLHEAMVDRLKSKRLIPEDAFRDELSDYLDRVYRQNEKRFQATVFDLAKSRPEAWEPV